MTLLIAWRNLWRHPRRTLVMLLAMAMGVWAMVFFSAFMRGMIDDMVRQNIANLTGHVQVQAPGFFENPIIENRIADVSELAKVLRETLPADARWTLRVRAGVVARGAHGSFGSTIVGIVPADEAGLSFIGSAAVEGAGLESRSDAILVGRALLERLQAKVGHRIVLDAQDAHGQIVSRAFTITGVFRAQMEATEKQFMFCRRDVLQQMLGIGDAVTEASMLLVRSDDAPVIAEALRARLASSTFRVLTWREIVPFVGAYLDSMNIYSLVWNIVVFIAMAFGLVNTVLMAVFERVREFGLVRALGVTPLGVLTGVLLETCLLLLAGLVIGGVISWSTVEVLGRVGIDFSAFAEGSELFGVSRVIHPAAQLVDYALAGATVALLGLLVSLYPAVKAARITPIEAMAHV